MKSIYKIYTCSHTWCISWICCVLSDIAATIIFVWCERVSMSESCKRKKSAKCSCCVTCLQCFFCKGKIKEIVCMAKFVTKASRNIKEQQNYFKIAGIQLLSALSWTILPFLVRLQVSKAFLCTTKQRCQIPVLKRNDRVDVLCWQVHSGFNIIFSKIKIHHIGILDTKSRICLKIKFYQII